MTPHAEDVLHKIIALKKVSSSAGFVSSRTQRRLLVALSEDELIDVSLELTKEVPALSGKTEVSK